LLGIASFFRERYDYRRAKVGGLEPAPGRLLGLLSGLCDLGFDDISLTTHGRGMNGKLSELQGAGLTRVTISIQHFDRDGYRRLTGRDGLAEALALVSEARAAGLAPLKVNRVLLRGHTSDLPDFLTWAQAEGVTVRLFDLMWQSGHDSHYGKYLVAWSEFLPLWEGDTERVGIRRYATSGRTRVQFHLRGGGVVETNLQQPKWHADAAVCRLCPQAEVCAEGYLGCGVRITPDLRLSPCILREDLSVTVTAAGDGRMDAILRGELPDTRLPLLVLGMDPEGAPRPLLAAPRKE
jgi:cyclic pyranopterin phosphate synthase